MWYRKLRTSARSLGKDESGANAVEFALVILVLVPFILAILEFGIILFTYNNMEQAARETARVLAVQEATLLRAEAVANAQLGFSGLNFTITRCAPDTADTCQGPDWPCDPPASPCLDPLKDVSVKIAVPLAEASLIDFFGFFSDGDLTATVTMRKEPEL